MNRTLSTWSGVLTAVFFAAALALPTPASAQKAVPRNGGSSQPSGGGKSGGGKSGGGSSGGGKSGGQSGSSTPRGANRVPAGDSGAKGGSGRTVVSKDDPNSGNSSGDNGNTGSSTAGTSSSTPSNPAPGESRPRGGQPKTGEAVARKGSPPPNGDGGGTTVIVPGGYYGNYYPWGYAGVGVGGYYGGYYDPWYYDSYQGYYHNEYEGELRLRVKPRDAQVFVDGYFAGIVDDFDGVFQRLHVEPGPHRVEIRLEGFEPLDFEVRILPERTVTYTGDLKRLTP